MRDFNNTDPHSIGLARVGEKVRFLDENAYDNELKNAQEFFTRNQELTVENVSIGGWSSSYRFVELPHKFFNTVMFEPLKPKD